MILNRNKTYSVANRFTLLFSVVAALFIPVGYFIISYQYLMGTMETEAEINSNLVSKLISTNPELWRYETIRIEELLTRRPRSGEAEIRRLFDEKNNLVAESVNSLPPLRVKSSREVRDSGEVVGRIEIFRSILPILLQSGVLSFLGLGLGLLMYRWLPFNDVITAGKQLQDSNNFLKKVMEGSSNSLVVLDLDGNIQMCNEHFETLSGFPREELIKQPFRRIFTGETLLQIESALHNVITEKDKSVRLEAVLLRHDGVSLNIFFGAVPLSSQGAISGVIISLDDITERILAEEELKKKNTEIEQFIYTVSHDLRSPLVTVKTFMGYLELDMGNNDQERIAQDIQFIHNAADKMKLLLDELLEMSRIGRIETPPVRVSFKDVVAEVLDALAGVINERNIDIQITDTDLLMFGDRPRFCQIWQNLIENAIKYSPDDRIPHIELGVRAVDEEVVFFVKDRGIGIDPQYHCKVFGIFEKLDPKSPGAGLGLSMVKRITEIYGGRIWVESEGTDKGSCVLFTLPKAAVQS